VFGCSKSANEEHYQAVEQNRNQQQQEAQAQAPNANAAPSASASPATGQASPSANTPTTASAHAGSNYWTSFRGPNRDGRYDEMPVLTNWPSQGLPLVWKEPVGVGYASFTVADGRAYTIEQRRRKEVVAAYDVNTGRELWTQAWNAEYTDETGDGPAHYTDVG
jgi:outer membrane protein assembly factor BamB